MALLEQQYIPPMTPTPGTMAHSGSVAGRALIVTEQPAVAIAASNALTAGSAKQGPVYGGPTPGGTGGPTGLIGVPG